MADCDYAKLVDALLFSVLAAGRVQLAHRRSGPVVSHKADASPVTVADEQSEEILLAGLARVMPGVAVVAEEAMSRGPAPVLGAEFFLVDPLDGTREYVKGSNDFCVNIALIVDRRPAFGIIYAPAKRSFYATLGAGKAIEADISTDAGPARLADCAMRPLRTRSPDPDALTAIASRSHHRAATEAFLNGLSIAGRTHIGSALKFCVIARGDADIYPRFGAINEWDTAAGHAILTASGGCVTTASGQDLGYGKLEAAFLNPPFVAWGRRELVRPFSAGGP